MAREILLFGNTNVVSISDIVEIEEKNVSFSIRKTKKNPEPKPTKGFFAKLTYSDTITYYETKSYTCLILKVKGGTQMRGKVDDDGNVSMRSNQLYDFYTIYNDKGLIDGVKQDLDDGNSEKIREIGNFFAYPGILHYSDYLNTNILFDKDISSKKDFIEKYLK